MKFIALTLIAAGLGATAHAGTPVRDPGTSMLPRAGWAPVDTADSLWRRGRIAVADEAWAEAAAHFRRLVDQHPRSAYAGDALYWQAFALQRVGGTGALRDAVKALETQKEKYPTAATVASGEAAALLTRINGRLAMAGDADAAFAVAGIAEIAAGAASLGAAIAAEVLPQVAAELQRVAPEIQAELARAMPEVKAELRAELAGARAEMAAANAEARAAAAARGGRESDIPPGCEHVIGSDRIEALNALLQMNAEQALPILKRVLERRDECSEVLRRKAVFLVSQKRTDEAVDVLVKAAKTDPDTRTRSEAIFWLSQTRNDRAVEVLEDVLRTETDIELQKRALFSMSQSRSPRAMEVLRDYARRKDAPSALRADAIFWLGQQRGEQEVRFLKELYPALDSDELRDKTVFAIAQQKSPDNGRWLLELAKDRRQSAQIRKSALFWAGQSGNASSKDLSDIYDNSANDRELRGQVVFTLSQRRNDKEALDKLVEIARKDQDAELRRQALFWLGQSKDPRAASIIEEIINKPL